MDVAQKPQTPCGNKRALRTVVTALTLPALSRTLRVTVNGSDWAAGGAGSGAAGRKLQDAAGAANTALDVVCLRVWLPTV